MARRIVTPEPRDEIVADGSWEFDETVTEVFDDMLARSIPQYELMRETVRDVGSKALDGFPPQTPLRILDLGTSRGSALDPLIRRYGARARYVGAESSQPMIDAATERFARWSDYVEIRNFDLRTGFPDGPWHLIQSVLTLQFVPIEHRERIVADAYDALHSGGALVVVEKVLGENRLDALLVDLYLERKAAAGYTRDQIEAKRHALEGVLVPITATWNVELLRNAGFWPIDCFWRFLNFAAWIAVKR